ncbi:MAG: HAMP domain-containing sensor histidine kinase [bacterium]|nr:HAMP domain-containing sensor histidine kinase [bacterium]
MSKLCIPDSLNIVKQCNKYGLPFWQCPHFLMIVLGSVVIVSSITTYLVGLRFSERPDFVVLIILSVSAFLIVIGFTIIHSFEKLADLARMKSEFVSVVTHQLRSPLSNLKWTIDLLASGRIEGVSEKQAGYLQILRENSQRMDSIVSDLLIVSRLQNNEFPLKPEKNSLAELAQKVVLRLAPFTMASNIKMETHIVSGLPDAFFDKTHIEQAIDNLISNAIHYVESKGLIEVSVLEKNNEIMFAVKDNGIGIPEEDQKFIFQKFFRGGNAARRQTQGSGLGLFIAKSIVEKSGGKIGFVSKKDNGSTFWFTLPIFTK